MADIKNLEGMIDSTPIMKDYADIESSALPEYQIDSKIPEGPLARNGQTIRHIRNSSTPPTSATST